MAAKILFSNLSSPDCPIEIGKTYWFAMVELGDKGNRFSRNVKPMPIILKSIYGEAHSYNDGKSYYHSPHNFNWDLSANPKYEKTTNSRYNITQSYYSALFHDKDDCVQWYNTKIKEAIQGLDGLKYRWNEEVLDVTRRNWAKCLIGEKLQFDDPIYSKTINMKQAIEFVRFYNSQQSIDESEISLIKNFLSKQK